MRLTPPSVDRRSVHDRSVSAHLARGAIVTSRGDDQVRQQQPDFAYGVTSQSAATNAR